MHHEESHAFAMVVVGEMGSHALVLPDPMRPVLWIYFHLLNRSTKPQW